MYRNGKTEKKIVCFAKVFSFLEKYVGQIEERNGKFYEIGKSS